MNLAPGEGAAGALQVAAWLLLTLALLGAVYAIAAAELLRRRLARRDPEPGDWPGITVLKPLHGDHAGLEQDLESVLAQDYAGPVQFLFGLQSRDDPALQVVHALRTRHSRRDIQIVVDPRLHGANGKVSNLINLATYARREIIVLSDSDIRHPTDYLRRVVAALEQPRVGAVTCLYVGRPEGREEGKQRLQTRSSRTARQAEPGPPDAAPLVAVPALRSASAGMARRKWMGLWPHLSALGIDQHFLPSVALGLAIGLAKPCFGSTIALRRETLEAIGGFRRFADLLADDYEIGRAVRALGLTVAVPSVIVEHAASEDSVRLLFAHELRWARTIRRIDPAGHAGTLVTNPLPLAMIGAGCALFAGGWPAAAAVGVLVLALVARLWLALRVAAATRHRAGPLWLTPVRDILSFIVYLASFGGDSVTWAGERFRTDKRGALSRRDR